MKGRYHIIIQNRRIKFELEVKRNITIIRGDSATGKTTLMNLIEANERLGDESGVDIFCERKCKTINNSNWEDVINQSSECVIFADEDTSSVKTRDFAEKIKGSDNYYVIITRENLPNLPYSVEEIYGIHNSGKYSDIRQTYNSLYNLYTFNDADKTFPIDVALIEDTNSGFEFFKSSVDPNIECISAVGKSKINKLVSNNKGKHILVIADGASFGPEIGDLYLYMKTNPDVAAYLPESFEWLVLASGLIDGNRIADIIDKPESYIESSKYFSWENYFTGLLVEETKDTFMQYSKSHLNSAYLNNRARNAILSVISNKVLNQIVPKTHE